MGGHISVGVRRADGSFRTIGVWTNPLKRYLTDARFLEGRLDPLDAFFARYLRREDDDGFGGLQDTVPGEYGFVLVDEIDRVVVNWNHYARMSTFRLDEFGIELGSDMASFDFLEDEDSMAIRQTLRPLVNGALVYSREDRAYGVVPAGRTISTDQDLADFIVSLPLETVNVGGKTLIRSTSGIRLQIASPVWKFIELDHFDRNAYPVIRGHVERCVTLSEAEADAWDDELRHLSGGEE